MATSLTAAELREALLLGERALKALGTPPVRPYNDDPDQQRAWDEQTMRYCEHLGGLQAYLRGVAASDRADASSWLRTFRQFVDQLEAERAGQVDHEHGFGTI